MTTKNAFGTTIRIATDAGVTHRLEVPALRLEILETGRRPRKQVVSLATAIIGTLETNDVVLKDRGVSRKHARIALTEAGILLEDLGSTNGTWFETGRVERLLLPDGGEFRLGSTTIRVAIKTENYQASTEPGTQLGQLVGGSEALRECCSLVRAAAPAPVTVLLAGESGCGKELLAQALHDQSGRDGAFVAVDCAATPRDLFPAELFGHAPGAFTGASEARKGAFRAAHGGTLFLDELGELPLELQSSLLRVLETRQVKALGSDHSEGVDVRVVAATNRDLAKEVQQGHFRQDLYYRCSAIQIRVPPLRERVVDIPILVEHFIQANRYTCRLPKKILAELCAHSWPGNVRELKNAVDRLGVLCRGRVVRDSDLSFLGTRQSSGPVSTIGELEGDAIRRALSVAQGNQTKAARLLGISLSTLKRRLGRDGSA